MIKLVKYTALAIMLALMLTPLAIANSNVNIANNGGAYPTGGSGFVVQSSKGYSLVATNYHVCTSNYKDVVFNGHDPIYGKDRVLSLNINIVGGTVNVKGFIIAVSPRQDLCLIKVRGSYPAYKLSESPRSDSEAVYYVNSARASKVYKVRYTGQDTASDVWSRWHQDSITFYGEHTYKGMSGSAILNEAGDVVAILWGVGENDKLGYTYAIKVEALQELIKAIK